MSLYKDKMTFQADELFADFVGKWMRLSGSIRDLNARSGSILVTFDQPVTEKLFMFFDASWKDRLSIIPQGTVISVECQITT